MPLLDTLEHIHVALGNSRPWLLTVLQGPLRLLLLGMCFDFRVIVFNWTELSTTAQVIKHQISYRDS